VIFLGLLNFLSRLRHPRAYAEHQRRVAELDYHLDSHLEVVDPSCRICRVREEEDRNSHSRRWGYETEPPVEEVEYRVLSEHAATGPMERLRCHALSADIEGTETVVQRRTVTTTFSAWEDDEPLPEKA
jgi:hypothetical protein